MKRWASLVFVLLLIALRFAGPGRHNPPEGAPLQAPAEVTAILERACFDCHSNLTVWPWYSHLPGFSYVIEGHVEKGRMNLNFSEWGNYPDGWRDKLVGEIIDEIAEGEMPLAGYLKLHPEAAVSGADMNVLKAWAKTQGGDDGHAH